MFKIRKIITLALTFCMVLSILPMGALADTIKYGDESGTTATYYYTGSKDPSTDSIAFTESGRTGVEHIYKYQLNLVGSSDPRDLLWTYCSDFSIAPVVNQQYTRMDIEKVTPYKPDNFFTEKEDPAKLRAILTQSDLFLNLAEIRTNTGISGLTAEEAIKAVQCAIWQVVNNVTPSETTLGNADSNVRKYYDYLLLLAGLDSDAMAKLEIREITKAYTPGNADTAYDVTINGAVTGLGISDVNINDLAVTAALKSGGSINEKIKVYTLNGTNKDPALAANEFMIVISGIPRSSEIDVKVSTTQENVKKVYIFYPTGGKGASQTLVTVDSVNVPLTADINVTLPVNHEKVTFFKEWRIGSKTGPAVASAVADGLKSVFSITYYNNGNSYDGLKVIGDVVLNGNANYESGLYFELGKNYKIEETVVDGKDNPVGTYVKYFKVVQNDTFLEIVWTDANMTPLTGAALVGANVFTNVYTEPTGAVSVTKTVTGALDALKDDTFELTAVYQKAGGGGSAPYANAEYELFTGAASGGMLTTTSEGKLSLKAGQTAKFYGIPVGSTLTVTEKAGGKAYYTYDTAAKQATVATDGEEKQITVTNTLKTGAITINKDVTGSEEISFATIGSIFFTVTDASGKEHTVELTSGSGNQSKTLTLPIGPFTVVEGTASMTGYNHTLTWSSVASYTYENGILSGEVTEGVAAVTYSAKNNYEKQVGSLTVSKAVSTGAGVTTVPSDKAFTFTLTFKGSPVANKAYTSNKTNGSTGTDGKFTLVAGETATFAGLDAGDYTVTEADAAIAELNLVTKAQIDAGAENETNSVVAAVPDKGTAEVKFTNAYSKYSGKIEITKVIAGDLTNTSTATADKTFTVTAYAVVGGITSETPSGSVTIGAPTWKGTIDGLEPGVYALVESDTGVTHYTVVDNSWSVADGKVTVANNGTAAATVTNTYTRQTASVAITKNITNYNEKYANHDFTFTVKADGETWNPMKYTVTGTGAPSGEQTSTNGTLTLKYGWTATVTVPAGAVITVTETVLTGYALASITSFTNGEATPESALFTTYALSSGTTASATFNNRRELGSLTLSKTFAGDSAGVTLAKVGTVTFTVSGPADWTPVAAENSAVSGSTLVVTRPEAAGDDWSYTLTNIPAGNYTVVETYTDPSGYTSDTTYTVNSTTNGSGISVTAAVSDSAEATVVFTNTYRLKVGAAVIGKTVDYSAVPDFSGIYNDIEFSFTATFSQAVTSTLKYTITGGTEQTAILETGNKEFKFTLKHGQTITITGIPEGVTVTVTETAPDGNIFETPVISPANGTITNNGTTINFTATNKVKAYTVNVQKQLFIGTALGSSTQLNAPTGGVTATASVKVVTASSSEKSYNVSLQIAAGSYASVVTAVKVPYGTVSVTESGAVAIAGYSYVTRGYVVNSVAESATVPTAVANGSTVVINNYYTRDTGELAVTKTVTAPSDPAFTGKEYAFTLKLGSDPVVGAAYTSSVGAERNDSTGEGGSFKLIAGEKITFAGLPTGDYTVTEGDSNVVGYTLEVTGTRTANVTKDGSSAITVTNTYTLKTGELKVTKSVTGLTNPETYSFKLYRSDNSPVISHSYLGSQSTGADGSFTITVPNGQTSSTVTFKGLPEGSYYVAEDAASAARPNYDVTTTGDTSANPKAVSTAQTSVPEIEVTNAYTRHVGSLTVEKKVSAPSDDTAFDGKEYAFTLKLGSDPVVGAAYTSSVGAGRNGSTLAGGSFTLIHGETVTFAGLPTGTYTVTEGDSNVVGYTLVVTDDGEKSAAVTKDTTSPVSFTNTYTRITDKTMTLTKTVGGTKLIGGTFTASDLPNGASTQFTFTVAGPSYWTPNAGNVSGATSASVDDGKLVIVLVAGQTATISALPGGEYTVTETALAVSGYVRSTVYTVGSTAAPAGLAATVAVEDNVAVECANTYSQKKGVFTLEKKYSGIEVAEWQTIKPSFEFTLIKINDGGAPDSYTADTGFTKVDITLDNANGYTLPAGINLPAGTYILTETTKDVSKFTFISAAWADGGGNITAPNVSADGMSILFTVSADDAADENISIVCTNTYIKDGAVLRVTKEAVGYAGEDEFEFLLEKGGVAYETSYILLLDDDGTVDTDEGGAAINHPAISGVFKLKAGQTAVFAGLDTETVYTVTERNLNSDKYALSGRSYTAYQAPSDNPLAAPGAGTAVPVADGGSAIAATMAKKLTEDFNPGLLFVFENTRHTGSLKLSKVVSDPVYNGEAFKFYLHFTNADGSDVIFADLVKAMFPSPENVPANVTANVTDECLEISVTPTGSVVIPKIPAGLKYSLTEDNSEFLYDSVYSDAESNKLIEKGVQSEVTVTNTRNTGTVSIEKNVIGGSAGDETFTVKVTFHTPAYAESSEHFKIDLPSCVPEIKPTASGTSGTDVIFTIGIKNGEKVTISEIPCGIAYDLQEVLSAGSKYQTRIIGYDGKVDPQPPQHAGSSKEDYKKDVIYIKNYLIPYNTLVVSKSVTSNDSEVLGYAYPFTLKLDTQDGTYLTKLIDELKERNAALNVKASDERKAILLEIEKLEPTDPKLTELNEDLKAVEAKIARFGEIGTKLAQNIYVEFNDDGNILFWQTTPPYKLNIQEQVKAYRKNGSEITDSTELEEIGFAPTSDKGVYSFKLKDGQHIKIIGLPENTAYSVQETDIAEPGLWQETKINGTPYTDRDELIFGGVIIDGSSEEKSNIAEFENIYDDVTGKLTVTKSWSGSVPSNLTRIRVQLVINGDPSTNEEHVKYIIKGENDVWSTVEFTDLPIGNKYAVLETVPGGYTASYSSNGITLDSEGITLDKENKDSAAITITNTYNVPDIPTSQQPSPSPSASPSTPPSASPSPSGSPEPSTSPAPSSEPSASPTPTPEVVIPPEIPRQPGTELVPKDDGYEVIDEDGTPLGKWTYDEEEEEWVYEEYPPLGNLPVTGGAEMNFMLLVGGALTGVTVLHRRKKYRVKHEDAQTE
ncbi:MAG: DUF5979 domain-containing protein [Oscillospiraceae bacterium]|jgi:LPXTG-motif cell wall-anchored protein|nr:DUF5979 domain-containing protein [Oscillospiraceae bacterium]